MRSEVNRLLGSNVFLFGLFSCLLVGILEITEDSNNEANYDTNPPERRQNNNQNDFSFCLIFGLQFIDYLVVLNHLLSYIGNRRISIALNRYCLVVLRCVC